MELRDYRIELQRIGTLRKAKMAELNALKDEVVQLTKQRDLLSATVISMEKDAVAASPPPPRPVKRVIEKPIDPPKRVTMSDHAVLRYLCRQIGFELEDMRAKLLTPNLKSAAEAGVEKVKNEEGTFVIRDRTIVTYYP